jgi:hypothetical protein
MEVIDHAMNGWVKINGRWIYPGFEMGASQVVVSKGPEKEPKQPKVVKPKKPKKIPLERVCSNCKHIRYTGVNQVTQQWGQCQKYKLSGVLAVGHTTEACPFFSERSRDKLANEHQRQVIMSEKLATVKIGNRRKSS